MIFVGEKMTSKERVRRAILFQGPDRIPFDLPEPWGSDFLWVNFPEDKPAKQVKSPPLSDYKNLGTYKFPNYKNSTKYVSVEEAISQNRGNKFVIAETPFGFIRMMEYLRGHETAWTDVHLYPQEFEKLLDRLTEIILEVIDNFSKVGVEGILFLDDWGLQDRLIISPNVWRKIWKPRYKKIFNFAHERGILTFLHSCGYIIDILGDLIEAELDVIQLDQQENMGVERLSKLFGGKICFWCPVDIQNTMVKGSIKDVKNYAKKLIDYFGKFNGGFMAKSYPSPEAVNHSKEKTEAMAETFVSYGK
jgi:uroporphyrinogen decarboxylase